VITYEEDFVSPVWGNCDKDRREDYSEDGCIQVAQPGRLAMNPLWTDDERLQSQSCDKSKLSNFRVAGLICMSGLPAGYQ
jgi:hypothetical protein